MNEIPKNVLPCVNKSTFLRITACFYMNYSDGRIGIVLYTRQLGCVGSTGF